MTTGSRIYLAALFAMLAVASPTLTSASNERGTVSVVDNIAVAGMPQAKVFDEIVSLRLRINSRNEVSLIQKCIVRGSWDDERRIPVGTRFYYEVVDYSGTVVAKGFRRDPRQIHGGKNVDFLLTAPYNPDCAYVNLYVVDYENGGRGGYSRDYALVGTFDIRQKQTASLD